MATIPVVPAGAATPLPAPSRGPYRIIAILVGGMLLMGFALGGMVVKFGCAASDTTDNAAAVDPDEAVAEALLQGEEAQADLEEGSEAAAAEDEVGVGPEDSSPVSGKEDPPEGTSSVPPVETPTAPPALPVPFSGPYTVIDCQLDDLEETLNQHAVDGYVPVTFFARDGDRVTIVFLRMVNR